MSLEDWKFLWDAIAVVAGLITAGAIAGAWVVGNKLAVEQTKQLLRLETDLSKQRELTAKAERKRLELQQATSARIIILNNRVLARLGKFAGTVFTIEAQAGDIEVQDIANSLGELLVKSGWSFRQGGTVHGEAFPEGIVAVVQPSSNLTAAASEMVSYLKADRIDSTVDLSANAPNDTVVIRVGPRPRAPLLNPAFQNHGQGTKSGN